MKKGALAAVLLLCCLGALTGCTASPPDNVMRFGTEGQILISASTAELSPAQREITLYYRYKDTACLAPETRLIQVQRNESLEKAVAQALIDGPGAASSALSPLFPPGTEALAAAVQEDTLFITFNEELLGRYADEPSDAAQGSWRVEGPLRRQLCLDALTATMTEAGLCSRVQVLVYRGAGQSTSMRLQNGFFTRSQDSALVPPLTRNESRLLTPHNTASLLLQAWQTQDWESLYDFTAREGVLARPGEQAALDGYASSAQLVDYSVSSGSVSPDGQSAVLTAEMTLSLRESSWSVQGYPLHLMREEGLWKMDQADVERLMNAGR